MGLLELTRAIGAMASLYSRLTRRKQVAVSPATEGAGLARVLTTVGKYLYNIYK